MPDPPQQLQYAAPAPWYTRLLTRQIVLSAAAAIVVLIAMWVWPTIYRRAGLVRYQRLCLTHTPPTDRVVFENQSPFNTLLLQKDPQYLQLTSAPAVTVFFAEEWRNFYSLYSPPGRQIGATLFLHERKTPDGAAYMVAIDATQADATNTAPAIQLNTNIFSIGSMLSAPKLLCSGSRRCAANNSTLRFYAGQIDPSNSAHFTIAYETGPRETPTHGTIDGYLRSDLSVKFEVQASQNPGMDIR